VQIIDCDQRSPEWFSARCGIPTTSSFDNIFTPTGDPTKKDRSDRYKNMLLAEWLAGGAVQTYQSKWMERGAELEEAAKGDYEFIQDQEITEVGFCLHESGDFGCSPDGLIGEDGLVEIKVPAPHTHISYLLADKFPAQYIPQVQGQLLVTGRKWCDFVSWNPGLDTFVIRVERDELYIADLRVALTKFIEKVCQDKIKLIDKGYNPIKVAA
jgi:predicted phage-related endonuclease